MLQLEARRAGPVVLGEEPDFCSQARAVGKPVTSGGKGCFTKEGSFLPGSQQRVQTPAKGMGFKSYQLLPLLQSVWTAPLWGV